MLIPIIQTDSIEDVQSKLDLYASIELPNKPTHIQIDVNDGFYTEHFSVQPFDLKDINWHGFTHEYHLLVDNPDEYLGDIVESGADTVIAQVEHMANRQNFLATAKQLKLKVGLALNFYTPINDLTDSDLNTTDLVLLMSYPAGWSGLDFKPEVLDKIKSLRSRGYSKMIEIDGGLNPTNIPSVLRAGATAVAVNSYIWHNGTVRENLKDLLKVTNY